MATPRKTTAAKPATRRTTLAARKTTAVRKTTATATKAAAAKAPPAKTAAASAGQKPASSPANAEATTPNVVMRKRQLIDMVVTRSGIKKKYAKPAIEAALAVLGDALRAGEDLNIPPLGRVKIQREIDQPKAKVLVTRIRQVKHLAVTPKDPLAEAAE